ncbi:M48 family metallopeptidase [Alicyclobacillus macrosporangiidus]|uniref:M48 family metallopeptidase n=1 Tax=Alicyclobacillus macrosporangiidus TaxID=392015 RepID=UPI0004952D5B|nr:M48 family metallopeptidase [Alicyclobacillus macrosporangiidus]
MWTGWMTVVGGIGLVALNLGLSVWIARHTRRLFRRLGSAEQALYRHRLLSQYVFGVVMLATCIAAPLSMVRYLRPLGHAGGAIAVVLPALVVVGLTLAHQAIQHPVLREIRQTAETRREQAGQALRWLALILVPVVLWNLAVVWIPDSIQNALDNNRLMSLLLPLVFVTVLNLLLPLFLRWTLRARPMPASALRDALEAFALRAGLGKVGLYVWSSRRGRQANALVSGYLHKHIYLADYLLDHLTQEEVEAVIAHEIGHVKRHHLWIRLLLVVGWVPLVEAIGWLGDTYAPDAPDWAAVGVLLLLFFAYFGFTVRYVSRVQERQADAYVLQLGIPAPVFISALLKLARLNQATVRLHRWDERLQTHPSFARRIEWIAQRAQLPSQMVDDMRATILH